MNHIKTMVIVLVIVLLIIMLFYLVRVAVMIWTGCSVEEATKKIRGVMKTSSPVYHIGEDQMLIQELWDAVHRIIGDARFSNLANLSAITPIFTKGMASGLPYIALGFPYNSVNEKVLAETLLSGILKKYLAIHGLTAQVLVDWPYSEELKMPFIMLRCAETEEEEVLLKRTIAQEWDQLIRKNGPVVDEDIEDV